jgi:hypothetical protein
MYNNTLDRGSDAVGKAAWVSALDHGMSKADLLIGFSNSFEHHLLIEHDLEFGVDFLH